MNPAQQMSPDDGGIVYTDPNYIIYKRNIRVPAVIPTDLIGLGIIMIKMKPAMIVASFKSVDDYNKCINWYIEELKQLTIEKEN